MTDENKAEIFKTVVSDEPVEAVDMAPAGAVDGIDAEFDKLMQANGGDDSYVPEKPKRRRRTKAEIAADEAANEAANEAADETPTTVEPVTSGGNVADVVLSERTRLEQEAGRRALRHAPRGPITIESPNIIIHRDPANQVPKFK